MRWFVIRSKPKSSSILYCRHKEDARAIITARVRYFAETEGFSYGRIAIKKQRRCWGSCSTKCNLNFNYKLMFLPPAIIDYVIVHELCHLRYFHHRPEFWLAVGNILPDYKVRIKILRQIEKLSSLTIKNLKYYK